ncbi:hypothetical protein JE034_00460 [Achromobacter xylosoxidans]|uniref:hypothetical protein n=1 Tax=Alcaligenes xylosoxydans xylosoxydans TaxID=85698 RepID=UPI001903D0F9|nr:hypothetical protein [Achromobacter xylosoxidans]MBK1977314.1 hypothetical protein [Achromobacter xylosoxidans]
MPSLPYDKSAMPKSVRRTSLKRHLVHRVRAGGQSTVDKILTRSSHIAQVGLFILTICALFYTVIPLYKTAALEEQIARREGELKATEQKLSETRAALAEVQERAYFRSRTDVLWNLRTTAAPNCSGLLRRPPRFLKRGEPPPPEPPLLDINVADCLNRYLAKTDASTILRSGDLNFLHLTVDRIARSLEEQRAESLTKMREIESWSIEELYALAPKPEGLQEIDEWMEEIREIYPGVLPVDPQAEHAKAVRNAQEKIARDFEERVRFEILQLRELTWPKTADPEPS